MELQKAKALDVVSLTEDLPQYGLSSGDRGTVVEVFSEPEEAYMVEFQKDPSRGSVIAEWVLPGQIQPLDTQAQALFEAGINHLNDGEIVAAVDSFQQAIKLKPGLIRLLRNGLSEKFAGNQDWKTFISHLPKSDEELETASRSEPAGAQDRNRPA
ncbi:MAG TPA: DUF4926 domain-containing protein [Pyrinomonadaceae bacterium]